MKIKLNSVEDKLRQRMSVLENEIAKAKPFEEAVLKKARAVQLDEAKVYLRNVQKAGLRENVDSPNYHHGHSVTGGITSCRDKINTLNRILEMISMLVVSQDGVVEMSNSFWNELDTELKGADRERYWLHERRGKR